MPVATEVLAGNNADDPLDRPAINKVKETLKNPNYFMWAIAKWQP
ncbi:hypothetical protein [Phormidium pseudopriestleyi]|nr:hypothetical protein [Phormidium pseudopriestleyi]